MISISMPPLFHIPVTWIWTELHLTVEVRCTHVVRFVSFTLEFWDMLWSITDVVIIFEWKWMMHFLFFNHQYILRYISMCPRFLPDCPPLVKIDLTQNEAATRPVGMVQFTANVQGMSIDNIMYYRWNIREFNYPLYTFSVTIRIYVIPSVRQKSVNH